MTQPIEPERHTVAYYVGLLSRPDIVEKRAYALRLIGDLAWHAHLGEAERLRRIVNLAAAAEQLAPGVLHYDKCGEGVLACGLTVVPAGSGYVIDETRVTCVPCRTAAQLDHSKECRDQLEERPCRFDCPARGES